MHCQKLKKIYALLFVIFLAQSPMNHHLGNERAIQHTLRSPYMAQTSRLVCYGLC